jgi:hypothetical protein
MLYTFAHVIFLAWDGKDEEWRDVRGGCLSSAIMPPLQQPWTSFYRSAVYDDELQRDENYINIYVRKGEKITLSYIEKMWLVQRHLQSGELSFPIGSYIPFIL